MGAMVVALAKREIIVKSVTDHSWWVYLLVCGDGSLYAGCTVDIAARLAQHNAGLGAKYTRSHLPVKLVYSEECADHSEALKREIALKRLTRTQKQQLVKRGSQKISTPQTL
jgi:putative endonuclease